MKYFYKDLVLEVPEGLYYPREDSELLAKTIEPMGIKGKKALDMGCGSGLISIIMAQKGAEVTSADINSDAVSAAMRNIEKNDVRIFALVSDLFENISESYDIVVFNPPYLPAEEKDATYSGGERGREIIGKFIGQAKDHLAENGIMLLLISSLTGEKEVLNLIEAHGMRAEVISREKLPWEELIVIKASAVL